LRTCDIFRCCVQVGIHISLRILCLNIPPVLFHLFRFKFFVF
jgi:hypothetical protein